MDGKYRHSIDAKGRLFIPAKLREELGVSFHLAAGAGNFLAIYPESTWQRFVDKVAAIPISQQPDEVRTFFANANKCEVDTQGRIVVPPELRGYAGLEKDVVVIGVNDRAEIWPAQAWSEREEDVMTPEKMKAAMAALGL